MKNIISCWWSLSEGIDSLTLNYPDPIKNKFDDDGIVGDCVLIWNPSIRV